VFERHGILLALAAIGVGVVAARPEDEVIRETLPDVPRKRAGRKSQQRWTGQTLHRPLSDASKSKTQSSSLQRMLRKRKGVW
jgi:hypothetical protein